MCNDATQGSTGLERREGARYPSGMIWRERPTLQNLNERCKETLINNLGIRFTELGDDYLKATMPVDSRTVQPYGLLHGGASAALAETLGSWGAVLRAGFDKACVGLEINVNHIRGVRQGQVVGTARPLHLGSSTQVWEIRIEDEEERLVAVSRLTVLVLG